MCLQRKKVHGGLRGAVCSVSRRLAVYYIATPVLPLQRIFPQTMRPKQDRKLHLGLRQGQAMRLSACRSAQRLTADWGRHTAGPDALKTGRYKQTFTDSNVLPTQYDREKKNRRLREGQAMRLSACRPAQRPARHRGRHTATPDALKTGHCKQKFTEFNVLATQYDREKENRRLLQGQVTRLSAHCPAQRPATDWGRHTVAPDALKAGRCKQTFTDFNVLPTQYDREKRFGASAKARRRAFQRAARPSVRQGIGGGTLPPPMH